MLHKNILVKDVAVGLSNFTYANNLQATKELMELFDYLKESKILGAYESSKPLENIKDYIKMYDENFYTYQTWEALVKSEEEQSDGWTEDECRAEINQTIFKLPCGWYVQYV
jgi:hypothetical protein